eukprot:5863593-Pleurochrysis_carterae.AAC.1
MSAYVWVVRRVFDVIDARERTLESLANFLSSMRYVRGAHRCMPTEIQQRVRSAAAGLLVGREDSHAVVRDLVGMVEKVRKDHQYKLNDPYS